MTQTDDQSIPPPDLKKRFEELKKQVLAERYVLEEILKKRGAKTLLDYANQYVDVNLSPAIPRRQSEFLSTLGEVVEERLGKTVADSVVRQMEKYYFVSTGDHTGPITHPFPLNSNLLTGAAIATHSDPDLQNVIVLSCANISIDNSDFPRGIFFHTHKDGELQTHRLGFYTSNYRPPSVYTLPAYTKAEVEKIYHALEVKCDKKEIGKSVYKKMVELVKEVYDQEDTYHSKDYAEQMTKSNFKLWQKLFEKSEVKLPNLISLGLEDMVVRLLIKYHFYKDTILNHMIFDPEYEPFMDKYFEDIHGSFSRKESSGTYLFWAIPKGSRYNLQLWREGNFLVSKDGSYRIELKPEIIQKALEEKELIPNLLLDFATISFYYGVKCLGGFDQVNYLTCMKNSYINMNVDLENYRSIEVCARAQTKEICVGLSFAFMEFGDHEVGLASGPDLYLYGDKMSWSRLLETVKELTLEDAISPLMPEMYKISFDEKEWNPELIAVTDKDISGLLGIHDKITPCIQIPDKTVKFVKLWPGGNTTAVVTEPIQRDKHAELAQEIMTENEDIEQVGYLETSSNPDAACRLQMMGGEFCMNATRSAAYYYAKQNNLKKMLMEASGCSELIEVEIEGETTHITLPSGFYLKSTKKDGYTIIDLSGIRHIVVRSFFDETAAQKMLEENKEDLEAVGVIFVSGENENIRIEPLVWVRETNTLVKETGCGSGSIAAAIAENQAHPELTYFNVKQRSGEIYKITLEPEEDGFKTIKLSGIVKILEQN